MNKIIDRLKTIWACALTLIVFRHPSTKLTFGIRVPFCIQRYNGLAISWPDYTKQSTMELTRQAKTFFPVTQFLCCAPGNQVDPLFPRHRPVSRHPASSLIALFRDDDHREFAEREINFSYVVVILIWSHQATTSTR